MRKDNVVLLGSKKKKCLIGGAGTVRIEKEKEKVKKKRCYE